MDYKCGSDIGYIGDIESSLACACTCKKRSDCKFFTWNAASNLCILKTTDGGRKPDSRAYSGSADCCDEKCIEEKIDYKGGSDIGYVGDIESSNSCACTCKKRSECKFFTWNAASNLCILKTTDGGRRPHSTADSGSEDCCVDEPNFNHWIHQYCQDDLLDTKTWKME